MSDRKLTPSTYYNCQPHKLNKNECNTCKDEGESNFVGFDWFVSGYCPPGSYEKD